MISNHDKNQLCGSIDKLMHYLAVHVKQETRIAVQHEDGTHLVYDRTFYPAEKIAISPTLYTRLDNCHGAGNCCRVPFDLVYTAFDRQRVLDYDHDTALVEFGKESAGGFADMRSDLLDSLVELNCTISQRIVINQGYGVQEHVWSTKLYVQRNAEKFWMSKQKSCPYLVMGEDRYFCGVHPFKPLHCWYPHMVIRAMESGEGLPPKSISIGRMQYGRNHNFGCPVIFTESSSRQAGLFETPGEDGPHYFDKQFKDDIDKLKWTSDSAESMGFSSDGNFAVGLHHALSGAQTEISQRLKQEKHTPITLWTKGE